MENKSIYEFCKKIDIDIKADFGGGSPAPKTFLMSYLIQNQNLKSYIEIGVYRGKSLFPAAYSIYKNNGKSYGIDPYMFDSAKEEDVEEKLKDKINDFFKNTDFEMLYRDLLVYKEECGYSESIEIIRKPSYDAIDYFIKNNIKTDIIHIDGNHDTKFVNLDYTKYYDILAEGGFFVFNDIDWDSVRTVYDKAKKQCPVIFENECFGILLKERPSIGRNIKIEKLSKKLYSIYKHVLNISLKEEDRTPFIIVGVITYNQYDYIDECLESIASQTGNFKMHIIVCDDCSTDDTDKKIESFIVRHENNSQFTIDYIKNESNIGVIANFSQLVSLIKRQNCDYFTFCEGDDYYTRNDRINKHLSLHQDNPNLAITFNSLMFYRQEEYKFEIWQMAVNKEFLSTESLAENNFIGNLNCSFIRGSVLEHINEDTFDMFTGDWMFHICCSNYGDIKFLNIPMNVYRKHKNGVWAGKDSVEKNKILLKEIDKYDRCLNFVYTRNFNIMRRKIICDINPQTLTAFEHYDLIIIADIFPHFLSGFSYTENKVILNEIPSSLVITTGNSISLLGIDTIDDLIVDFKQKHPELSKKLYNFNEDLTINTRLLYAIFLNDTFNYILPIAEKFKIPFIFTLYPGGGFVLENEDSDDKLKRVFDSLYFKKVIVTQKITYEYLLYKGFCKEEDIELIFGIVTPLEKLSLEIKNKKHYGFEKETLDICFVAHKYTQFGEDKGYDIFIEAAKKVSNLHDNIYFHIVGPWDEKVLDIGGIKNIHFYGSRNQDWFDEFYSDKDIIISPNINGKISEGSFDGFPTGSSTEAALREVAIFGTDPLKLNNGVFCDKKDFVFIEHDADDIVCKIDYFYNNPDELKKICENGQAKIREVYSYDRQLKPRIQILNTALKDQPFKNMSTPFHMNNNVENITRIPVMHCFDNNYSIPAAVSMYSMLFHANKSYNYILYVLHTDITSQNRAKLYDIVKNFPNAELEFIDMNNRFDGLLNKSVHGYFTKEVLYKLIAPSIFPQHDKLIITDVDVVFLSDISESYFCFEKLTEKLVAGTKHTCPSDSFIECYYLTQYSARFGENFLNKLKICGGYLVYHLDNMRKNNIEDKFLKYLAENIGNLPQAEQDVINFCLNDNQIEYLPLNYVVCSYMYEIFNEPDKLETDHYYNKNQIIDALKNPIQLHYATGKKPWNTGYCTKSEVWYEYLLKCGLLKEQMQKKAAQKTDEPEIIDCCSNIDVLNYVYPEEREQQVTVSVLCCTYNHREFIEKTLEGIMSQKTDFDFEVIISDDASTDGTQDIICKFRDKYPNQIRSVLRDVNVGIGGNYYEALKIVKGKYLAICDGDDFWIDNHKLQEQVDFLERNGNFTICCSSFNTTDNGINDTFFVDEYIQKNYLLKDSYGFRDILNCRFVASCTTVMRWKLLGNVPEFIRQYDIIDFQLVLIHAAFGKIKVMNDRIYSQYNIHSQSITQSTRINDFIAQLRMIVNEVNQFLDYKFDKTVRRFLSEGPEAKPVHSEIVSGNCKKPLTVKTIIRWCYIELVPELAKKLYRKIKKNFGRNINNKADKS